MTLSIGAISRVSKSEGFIDNDAGKFGTFPLLLYIDAAYLVYKR